MELNYKNIVFKLDWKSVVGLGTVLGTTVILNILSKRRQLESFEIDLDNKKLCLN